MEEDGIGLVLGRAMELRLKITNCIHNAATVATTSQLTQSEVEICGSRNEVKEAEEEDEEGDETERLLSISDALESLELLLYNLQVLQQQQQYEREAALAEIDYNRKVLLNKLKEYKGKDLEVIREASVFAGETVAHNNGLMLPPYSSRPPHSLVLETGYLSHFPSTQELLQNGVVTHNPSNQIIKNLGDLDTDQMQAAAEAPKKRGILFTVLTVSVLSVLILAGYGPKLGVKGTPIKIMKLFQQPSTKEKRSILQCPPGKFLVVENGEPRCIVKERIEIPFGSSLTAPNLNYGCG